MRSTPTRAAGAAAVAALLAISTVSLAVSGGDPEQPTRSRSALLTIGQPIEPYRAGSPPGWIEMRISEPGGGRQRAALSYRTHKLRRGHTVQLLCSRIGQAGHRRSLSLSAVGRAFIAVYPAAVDPQAITLEVTLADGTIERHQRATPAQRGPPRRAATAPHPPHRAAPPPRGPDQARPQCDAEPAAKRFGVKLAGREVHMHRDGGSDSRPRYTGTYDRSRGSPRTFITGHVYLTSFVLCGAEGCSATTMRSRLR